MTMTTMGVLLGIAAWILFPLRMLLDRSMAWTARWNWALLCAVLPVAGYLAFLIVRLVRERSIASRTA